MIENRIEEREALAGNDVETFYMDIFSIDRSKVIEMLEQYPRLATRKIRTVGRLPSAERAVTNI